MPEVSKSGSKADSPGPTRKAESLQPEVQRENVFDSPGKSGDQPGLGITNHTCFHSFSLFRSHTGSRISSGTVGTR